MNPASIPAALVFLVLASAQAHAAEQTVFGIAIGATLTAPYCEQGASLMSIQTMCADRSMSVDKAWGSTDMLVYFPVNRAPSFVKFERFYVSLIDGKVEAVSFSTRGETAQLEIIDELAKKYGKPKQLQKRQLQNRMGARFIAYAAKWRLPGITVEFDGILDDPDTGQVAVTTDRFNAVFSNWQKAQEAATPKM